MKNPRRWSFALAQPLFAILILFLAVTTSKAQTFRGTILGLSITHKFSSHEESDLNISKAGESLPDDLIPGRRIARTSKIAS